MTRVQNLARVVPELALGVVLLGLLAGVGAAASPAHPADPVLACTSSPRCPGGPPPARSVLG